MLQQQLGYNSVVKTVGLALEQSSGIEWHFTFDIAKRKITTLSWHLCGSHKWDKKREFQKERALTRTKNAKAKWWGSGVHSHREKRLGRDKWQYVVQVATKEK